MLKFHPKFKDGDGDFDTNQVIYQIMDSREKKSTNNEDFKLTLTSSLSNGSGSSVTSSKIANCFDFHS